MGGSSVHVCTPLGLAPLEGKVRKKQNEILGKEKTQVEQCLGLKGRCLPRRAGAPFGMENILKYDPLPSKLLLLKLKGLSDKYMRKGIPVLC